MQARNKLSDLYSKQPIASMRLRLAIFAKRRAEVNCEKEDGIIPRVYIYMMQLICAEPNSSSILKPDNEL